VFHPRHQLVGRIGLPRIRPEDDHVRKHGATLSV
jgi:hypothetical protein